MRSAQKHFALFTKKCAKMDVREVPEKRDMCANHTLTLIPLNAIRT